MQQPSDLQWDALLVYTEKSVTQVVRYFLGETKFERPNPLSGILFHIRIKLFKFVEISLSTLLLITQAN